MLVACCCSGQLGDADALTSGVSAAFIGAAGVAVAGVLIAGAALRGRRSVVQAAERQSANV
ncbi:hypothetical protein ACSHWB_35560 [Lentzea sp. HUAS TT2]|uniref:hypothetical protein n=1 Tax=Lentzea sp. HUAS TT2 TaxID=3447454 RepID=UPI003F71E0F6